MILTANDIKQSIPKPKVNRNAPKRAAGHLSNAAFLEMLPRMQKHSGVKSSAEMVDILNAEGYKVDQARVRVCFRLGGLTLARKRRWMVAPQSQHWNRSL